MCIVYSGGLLYVQCTCLLRFIGRFRPHTAVSHFVHLHTKELLHPLEKYSPKKLMLP